MPLLQAIYNHNFKKVVRFVNDVPSLRKPKKGWAKFWCDKCDTLVQYSARRTEHEVNQLMAQSKLPCAGEFTGEVHIS